MGGSHDPLFVGIDWATEAHQICIVNDRGEMISERTVQHSGPALAEFIDGLLRLCEGELSRIVIGIEVPRGALVETLTERGWAVYAINPKQLDRFRDRHFPAGQKMIVATHTSSRHRYAPIFDAFISSGWTSQPSFGCAIYPGWIMNCD